MFSSAPRLDGAAAEKKLLKGPRMTFKETDRLYLMAEVVHIHGPKYMPLFERLAENATRLWRETVASPKRAIDIPTKPQYRHPRMIVLVAERPLPLRGRSMTPNNAAAKRPGRRSQSSTTPLRLALAAEIAFPDGSIGVKGLRRERDAGRLTTFKIAGKEFTTLAEIEEMRERCRVQPKVPASNERRKLQKGRVAPKPGRLVHPRRSNLHQHWMRQECAC